MLIDFQQLETIFYSSFFTVFCGVTIFVFGQFIDKFILEPLSRFEKTRGEIDYHLLFFANIYVNPGTASDDELSKLFSRLRELAVQIITDTYTIRGYWLLVFLRIVPSRRDVGFATNEMFLFPMSFHPGSIDITEIVNILHKISKLLHLHMFPKINMDKINHKSHTLFWRK
jgi:hypothetical protein